MEIFARNCDDGKLLATETAKVDAPSVVLSSLITACDRMRHRLGESQESIQKFDVSLEQATTGSLAALRAFQLGEQKRSAGHEIESREDFKLAVDLDPQFALAWEQLGHTYSGEGERGVSATYYRKAFDLREHATDNERLHIATSYYTFGTGEIPHAIEANLIWANLYPQDVAAPQNLSFEYMELGQTEKALPFIRKAVEIAPALPYPQTSLAHADLQLGHFAELNKMCADPAAPAAHSVKFRTVCYLAAFVQHDPGTMQRELTAAKGAGEEPTMLWEAAMIAIQRGQLQKGREIYALARKESLERDRPEFAERIGLDIAMLEAELNFHEQAKNYLQEALQLHAVVSPAEAAVISDFATGNESKTMRTDLQKLSALQPLDTIVNSIEIPATLGEIDLREKHPEQALRDLEVVKPYDLSETSTFSTSYYRGLAYEALNRPKDAATELQFVLDHKYYWSPSLYLPLSQLQLARAELDMGKVADARKNLDKLAMLWHDADKDFPPLQELKALQDRASR